MHNTKLWRSNDAESLFIDENVLLINTERAKLTFQHFTHRSVAPLHLVTLQTWVLCCSSQFWQTECWNFLILYSLQVFASSEKHWTNKAGKTLPVMGSDIKTKSPVNGISHPPGTQEASALRTTNRQSPINSYPLQPIIIIETQHFWTVSNFTKHLVELNMLNWIELKLILLNWIEHLVLWLLSWKIWHDEVKDEMLDDWWLSTQCTMPIIIE